MSSETDLAKSCVDASNSFKRANSFLFIYIYIRYAAYGKCLFIKLNIDIR